MNELNTTPDQQLRVMQIIAFALPMGVVVVALIAVFALGALQQPAGGELLSLMGAGFAALMFVLHLALPRLLFRLSTQTSEPHNPGPYLAFYQTRMIFGLALLEGAAMFNIIVLIIEHHGWSLVIVGCLVSRMLLMFPTRTRVEQSIETQRMLQDR